jgi:L-aminopeptidase/D-esterase-like protein
LLDDITDVPGILVGHAEDKRALTGCTVVLCESGAVGGADVRGTAAGCRQMDALGLLHVVDHVHSVFLAGGSAYGLDAAAGVMRFLEERGVGFHTRYASIPIVPTAVIFDLSLGDARVRPNAEMAYRACLEARTGPVPQGSVGAGIGASVGKYHGITRAMKGGLGSASLTGAGGVVVGALSVVNAFGDVVDPHTGQKQAGVRDSERGVTLIGASTEIRRGIPRQLSAFENTTLVVVATNVRLTKTQATKMAQMAQVGLAKTLSPAHSAFDGDVVFVLSIGELEGDLMHVGGLAEEATSISILRAVKEAESLGQVPAWRDIKKSESLDDL